MPSNLINFVSDVRIPFMEGVKFLFRRHYRNLSKTDFGNLSTEFLTSKQNYWILISSPIFINLIQYLGTPCTVKLISAN